VSPERKDLVRMLAIGITAAVIGTFVALQIDWFPAQGDTAAHKIDTLYDWLLVASVPMFVLVMSVAIYSVVRFRVRPGGPTGDGAPIHGNTRLEIIWVTIPFVIVTALAVYAAVVLAQIEEKKPNELQVRAIGQQFTWHFEYTQGGKKFTAAQLYLPNNRPVYMKINTRDVIHSFWVPAFRVKEDAVPGQTDHVRFTPNRLGNYEVVCAELCGVGHATMRVKAAVVSPQEFQKWAQAIQKPAGQAVAGGGAAAGGAPTASAAQGKSIFTGEGGCGACHTLADAGTTGTVGPNLSKVKIAGKGAAFIKQSIEDPNAEITPGFPKSVMPQDFKTRLGPEKIDALVKYLLQAGK
jgi:cytochrome c oxidase subunit 2